MQQQFLAYTIVTKGSMSSTALQLANKLIYQSELVADQQNEVNSF